MAEFQARLGLHSETLSQNGTKHTPPKKKTHILTYTHTHKIGLGSVSLREGNGWHLYGLRWPLSAPSELSLQFFLATAFSQKNVFIDSSSYYHSQKSKTDSSNIPM